MKRFRAWPRFVTVGGVGVRERAHGAVRAGAIRYTPPCVHVRARVLAQTRAQALSDGPAWSGLALLRGQ
eukprot:1361030-Alexandrium_andersonii.AAC.1